MDWASCGFAKTRLPPCTGAPELVEELPPEFDDDPPLDPQPAMRARAEPAMRVFMRTMRCLTGSSRVSPGDGSAAALSALDVLTVSGGLRPDMARRCAASKPLPNQM